MLHLNYSGYSGDTEIKYPGGKYIESCPMMLFWSQITRTLLKIIYYDQIEWIIRGRPDSETGQDRGRESEQVLKEKWGILSQ